MDLLTCTNTFVSHADRLIGLFSTFLVLLVLFSLLITFALFSLLITFFTFFNCFPFHCFSLFFKDLATASEDNYTFNVVRKILQVVVPALPAKHMHAVMNVFVGSFGKMELVLLDNFWVFCC